VQGYTILGPGGEKIYLIDTPGFDDTQISDVELLKKIASALEAMYVDEDIRFAGLIYMHRITDSRVAGSSLKSLRIFEKICGEENFKHVVLVTSMWNLLEDEEIGKGRERTLETKDEFFGRMISRGAVTVRDRGDLPSAWTIIERALRSQDQVVTALQREMATVGNTLEDTTVGAFLREQLEEARRKYELERQELEEALMEAKQEGDDLMISTISEQSQELNERAEQTITDEENLSTTRADLARIRDEWCARNLAQLEKDKSELRVLQAYENEVSSLREIIRMKDDLHRRELKAHRKQAKGNEQALMMANVERERELKQLREELKQKTTEVEVKFAGIKKAKIKERGDFFSRLVDVMEFKGLFSLSRSQSFASFPDPTSMPQRSRATSNRSPHKGSRRLPEIVDFDYSSSSSEVEEEPYWHMRRSQTLPPGGATLSTQAHSATEAHRPVRSSTSFSETGYPEGVLVQGPRRRLEPPSTHPPIQYHYG
jgi:hypothetical protein